MSTTAPTFPTWQPRFLAALAKTGNVLLAAQRAHITRQNAYLARSTRNRTGQARLQALAFAQCWQMALQESFLPLQEALYDRAMHGVERQKPIYYKGKQVGVQKWTVYNDSLLIHLHKSIESEINKADALLGDYDLTRLSPSDFAERETIENLIDDLWCQVLDILEPAPKSQPSKTAAPEPEEFISPEAVSSPLATPPSPGVLFHGDRRKGARRAEGALPLPSSPTVSGRIPEIFSQPIVSSPLIFQEPDQANPDPSLTPLPAQSHVGAHGDRFSGRAVPCAPQTLPTNTPAPFSTPEIFSQSVVSSPPIFSSPSLSSLTQFQNLCKMAAWFKAQQSPEIHIGNGST